MDNFPSRSSPSTGALPSSPQIWSELRIASIRIRVLSLALFCSETEVTKNLRGVFNQSRRSARCGL
ncbi:hypothetical protein ACFPRL_28800 [Pseudoclavibacter helvolus]